MWQHPHKARRPQAKEAFLAADDVTQPITVTPGRNSLRLACSDVILTSFPTLLSHSTTCNHPENTHKKRFSALSCLKIPSFDRASKVTYLCMPLTLIGHGHSPLLWPEMGYVTVFDHLTNQNVLQCEHKGV